MDEQVLKIFRIEVETQCRCILLASERVGRGPGEPGEIWMHLQTIVVSAANLSKIFWGSGGSGEDDRRPLRDLLEVRDDSPLRDPDLRNDFEHFDKRLKLWYERPDRSGYVGRNVTYSYPSEAVHFTHPEERFHHYEGVTGVVSFWEHEVSVPAVTAEAARILERCRALAELELEEERRRSEQEPQ